MKKSIESNNRRAFNVENKRTGQMVLHSLNAKRCTLNAKRGFTLIELMVVVGIIVLISGIILANHAKFGGQVMLRNLAYDMALSIRQAQVYGISSRSFNGAKFTAGHGAYFDINNKSQFFLYTDLDNNKFFTPLNNNEIVETYSLGKSYTIDSLCIPIGQTENCNVIKLDILFKRPEPDAIIRAYIGSGWAKYDSARIVVVSPRGEKLSVLVEATGQISVQRYNK